MRHGSKRFDCLVLVELFLSLVLASTICWLLQHLVLLYVTGSPSNVRLQTLVILTYLPVSTLTVFIALAILTSVIAIIKIGYGVRLMSANAEDIREYYKWSNGYITPYRVGSAAIGFACLFLIASIVFSVCACRAADPQYVNTPTHTIVTQGAQPMQYQHQPGQTNTFGMQPPPYSIQPPQYFAHATPQVHQPGAVNPAWPYGPQGNAVFAK